MKLSQTEPLANELKCMVLDEYLAAQTFEQFEQAFQRIRSKSASLPKYAREGIQQYRQGILDVIARLKGQPVSVSMRHRRYRRRASPDTPLNIRKLQPGRWHRHSNGGGWVSSTAHVDATAYIARGCVVFNQAQVLDHAKLLGQVRAAERAVIKDQAVIRGTAFVHGDAVLQDKASIGGQADVAGHIRLGGHVKIGGDTVLRGDLELGASSNEMPSNETSLSAVAN